MIVLNNNNRKEKIFHPNTHVHTHTQTFNILAFMFLQLLCNYKIVKILNDLYYSTNILFRLIDK